MTLDLQGYRSGSMDEVLSRKISPLRQEHEAERGGSMKLLFLVGAPYSLVALTLLLISLPLPLISEEFDLPGHLSGFLVGTVSIGMPTLFI